VVPITHHVSPTFALVVGMTASLIGLGAYIPQVVRARRTSVEGLSWGSQLLTLATWVVWAVYGLFIVDGIQIFNNVTGLLLNVALIAAIIAAQPTRRPAQVGGVIVATAAVSALIAVFLNPLTVGMIGSVIGVVRQIPQLRLALSGRPLWGLDPWAVQLAVVSSGIWLVYGLAATDLALISSAGFALAFALIIAARRLPPRRTLRSVANGRIGPHAARCATPVANLVRAPANTAPAPQATIAA
jgi:uncharacterized protein with PQ loop repeat